MDTNYVALLNIPTTLHEPLRVFLCLFQSAIYDIPMKWEPEGNTVTRCEASLTRGGLMVLKGLPTPGSAPDTSPLWHRWPDRWSPSCPVTLQSMLPSIVLKATTLCFDPVARQLNFQTIV